MDLGYFTVMIITLWLGTCLGGYLRDGVWIGKADSGTRMLCRGKFYNITRTS